MDTYSFTDEQVKDMSSAQRASLGVGKSGGVYTSTKGSSAKFGGTLVPPTNSTKTKEPTTEVGSTSSFNGEQYLKQLQGIEKKLSGFQQMFDEKGNYVPGVTNVDQTKRGGRGTEQEPLTNRQVEDLSQQGITEGDTVPGKGKLSPRGTVPQATAEVINPETEQTQTFTGTPEEVQKRVETAKGQGYEVSSFQEDGLTEPTNPDITRLETERNAAIKDVETLQSKLEGLIITDSELRGQIRAINKTWEARKDEQRDITERQIGQITTLGMRRGARYTGGGGGVWGGIISEAERQGVLALADLDAQQQTKVMEARSAAREFNYGVYADLIESANELETSKATELANLKEAQAEQDRQIAEQKRKLEVDDAVSQYVMGDPEQGIDGITDPNVLFDLINRDSEGNLIGDVSLEEIDAAIRVENPDADALAGLDQDYRTFAYLQSIDDPVVRGMTYDQYLRMIGNAKRAPTTGGSSSGTESERKAQKISQYANVITVPGAQYDTGGGRYDYILGEDGYISPKAWKTFSSDAQASGVSREEFVQSFGYLLNPQQWDNDDWEQYGLTPAELKVAGYE